MNQYILKENVLTDDVLLIPGEGKIFHGGYVAIVKENLFQTSWTDKEIVHRFRKESSLNKFLSKKYPDFNFY